MSEGLVMLLDLIVEQQETIVELLQVNFIDHKIDKQTGAEIFASATRGRAAIARLREKLLKEDLELDKAAHKLPAILSMEFDTIHGAGRRLREVVNREGAGSAVEIGSEDYVIRAAIVALFKEDL